jgi:hypothetical protein
MISNMTRNIAHVAKNNNFKSVQAKKISFKREPKKYVPSKADPPPLISERMHTSCVTTDDDVLGEPSEKKCAMEDTRDFYRRSVNKRWNHWAMTDLEPLPRRTVVNKFKKNKGLLFKRGMKYETSNVNKRAMHIAVQRERSMKYDETPCDQDTRLNEDYAYWSAVPSRYAIPSVSEIEMELYDRVSGNDDVMIQQGLSGRATGYDDVPDNMLVCLEEYWYNVYHELPPSSAYATTW